MDEKIIESGEVHTVEKPKRTRRKPATKKVEQLEVQETPAKAPETDSKADAEPKLIGYRARVTAGLLNVRERPTKASKTVGDPLKGNTVVQIVAEENGWGMITNGYVMLDYIERID